MVNDLGGSRAGSGTDHAAADAVVSEIRKAGGTAQANYDSVSSKEGARAIVDKAISAFGRVDVMLNNAGILRDKTLLKLSLEDWQADCLSIVREESYYFAPQGMTKVMNEGWASFWHSTLMTKHFVEAKEIIGGFMIVSAPPHGISPSTSDSTQAALPPPGERSDSRRPTRSRRISRAGDFQF